MTILKEGGINYLDQFNRLRHTYSSIDTNLISHGSLRVVGWGDYVLVEKRYAAPKIELTTKLPLGGDDEGLKAYRVGLSAYAEKRHHPDNPKVARTDVIFRPDFYLSALPKDYIVAYYLESLRSDGRWKKFIYYQGIPYVKGGKDTVGSISALQSRTTHSKAVITKVRIRHILMLNSYLSKARLVQINTTLTNALHRVSDSFKKPPRQ
jgi:hypothetical protein